MNQYDVYGVGNALVDVEYEVTPDQLSELGIDKGVMTLVDEEQQARIIARLGAQERERGSGGSAANTIIAVSQMGGRSYYSCRVADDEMGHFYLDDLVRAGVSTKLSRDNLVHGVTGKCLVLITADADRTMNTFLGVSADISPENLDEEAIASSEYIYLEGYLVTGDAGKATAVHARRLADRRDTKVAFTLSDPNIVKFFRAGVEELLGDGVDLLFANEEEALALADVKDLDAAMPAIKSIARRFVVTRGPKGAVIYDGDAFHDVAPVPTQAVDTVGAGDMFAGAFLYGITNGMSFPQAGQLAAHAGSKIVSSFGPRLKLEETQAVLARFLEGSH